MEIQNQISGAKQFDFAVVKKMTSSKLFDECKVPVFQWRVMDVTFNSKTWESQLFPVNRNQNVGQLHLNYSKGYHWILTMSLDDYGKQEPSELNKSSYFVVKYKYNLNKSSLYDEDFCGQIMVFGTCNGKATIFWYYECEDVHSVLIEVYQVPAAIPNFFLPPSNHSMIVGECDIYKETKKLEQQIRMVDEQRCFCFGSAEQRMTVSFLNSCREKKDDRRYGVTAILHIVNEREMNFVPFVATFTIFSQWKNKMEDLVNKIVIRRAEKQFHHEMFLAFYDELDELMEKTTLFYKVVLEPLTDKLI